MLGSRVLMIALVGTLAIVAQADHPTTAEQRKALESLSRAAPDVRWDSKRMVNGDLACDGRSDQAYLGHAVGKVYVGLFRAKDEKTQVLEFHVGGGYQDGICREPAKLALESLNYDLDTEVKGFQQSKICKGLVLSDNECDPVHFFWNRATQQLNWWRN